MNLKESVEKFVLDRKEYYKQWMFNEPIIISKSHNDKLIRLQKIMHKLIYEFVTSYDKYKHLMPVDDKVNKIITLFNQKKYKIGTYRTDFVYDKNNQVKLIEITCRFALNGVFLPALINSVAQDYKSKEVRYLEVENLYNPIYKHLEGYLKNVNSIVILKGSDIRNESKIYKDIFLRMGLDVKEINYKNIKQDINSLKNSWIISELSFDEIKSFSDETIEQLMSLNIINDFRTIFLIHDKRFFSVLGKKILLNAVLTKEEIHFFNNFYIPTYTSNEAKKIWEEAKKDKNKWILKHRALGKSKKVYAGSLTEQKEWETLFSDPEKKDMILQKWVPQKRILGEIGSEKFEDFITGTLLFFDNNYFGMGDFRTSSHPVTNIVDHRKACSLIRSEEKKDLPTIKNYIN
ncbi:MULTISPECIES: hypothetical protein [Tenacibaculum]|uniref:hypothetical protein n=1 Tax=Tenacibaculum TaxID=104267 RepID=UPI001F0B5E1C|nr:MULTISPECIES: hypothetical protein [Tenacibaculum]MCH3881560.1 hypothetical protein [Tenacibaculum aquimarinum]MDO6598845.1 hypothetical protein [Tenacibaculum sp. 1_MG-2023]